MKFDRLTKHLQYHFKDENLLLRALTHRSIRGKNNERLEFLGDAILSFIIADELFHRQPDSREGVMSRLRSLMVNGEVLAKIARDMHIGDYLHLGPGEQKSGGSERESILADALEAIIGAIYIDSDIDTCRQCILSWYANYFEDISELPPDKDAKSTLQEWTQANKYPLPTYSCEVSGKSHQQIFHVICRVEGLTHQASAKSSNRRKAEQLAAEQYLKWLK